MLDLIHDIELALDNGNLRCALGMALTLPDICGIVEFPGCDKVEKRYVGWCDSYLFNQGFFPTHVIDLDNPPEKEELSRAISGDMCYKLRCAYLHSGNLELNQRKNDDFPVFHLQLTSSEENGIYMGKDSKDSTGKISDKHIDARYLIRVLCNAAKDYYNNSNNKDNFTNHHIEILDIEYELQRVEVSKTKFLKRQKEKANIKSYDELSEEAKEIYRFVVADKKETIIKMMDHNPDAVMAMMELLEGGFISVDETRLTNSR